MRIAMILTRPRIEEKLLLKAFGERGIEPALIFDEDLILNPASIDPSWFEFDVVLERSLSSSRGLYILEMLNTWGVPTVNSYGTSARCADKFRTTLALARAGVAQPGVRLTFARGSALTAIAELDYPAVLKPLVGSWGRLIAKVNDVDAAEAVLEHRETLGDYLYHTHYIQTYVEKPEGRDIRAFVVGGELICAIYRSSSHWLTNTARGATASTCPLTPELTGTCQRASQALGGGLLAIDLFETDEGLLVNEINHTMEFRNSIEPTGVDIPGFMADHVISVGEQSRQKAGEQA